MLIFVGRRRGRARAIKLSRDFHDRTLVRSSRLMAEDLPRRPM
jgi:hypothetical protein